MTWGSQKRRRLVLDLCWRKQKLFRSQVYWAELMETYSWILKLLANRYWRAHLSRTTAKAWTVKPRNKSKVWASKNPAKKLVHQARSTPPLWSCANTKPHRVQTPQQLLLLVQNRPCIKIHHMWKWWPLTSWRPFTICELIKCSKCNTWTNRITISYSNNSNTWSNSRKYNN